MYNSTYGELPIPTRNGYTFLGWNEKDQILPNQYQKVEYVRFLTGSYIDTEIIPTNHTINIKFDYETYTSDEFLFGTSKGSSYFFTSSYNNKYVFGHDGNKSWTGYGNWTTGDHHLIYNGDNNSIVLDGTELESGYGISSPATLWIGRRDSTANFTGKIYYAKITDKSTGKVVRNLVPCYRKSDNVIGLYDTISGKFYTNNGTGTFNKGDEVENNYITSSTKVITNEDHTLYAMWGHNPTITFDPNGGTVSPANKALVYNSTYGELPTPIKSGYTFVGWKPRNDDYILPSQYQEVEYIESSGTQYINTGVIPSNTTGVYTKLSSSNITSNLIYFGSRNTQDGRFWVGNETSKIYYGWNTNTYRSNIVANTVNIIKHNYLNDRKSMFNDEVIRDIGSTSLSSNTRPIYIFAGNDKGSASYKSSIKLYEFKISDGDDIIHNYIPCYRISDNVIGLYDIVEGIFYDNKGSGTFEQGSNIYNVTSESIVITAEDHTLYAIWEEK